MITLGLLLTALNLTVVALNMFVFKLPLSALILLVPGVAVGFIWTFLWFERR